MRWSSTTIPGSASICRPAGETGSKRPISSARSKRAAPPGEGADGGERIGRAERVQPRPQRAIDLAAAIDALGQGIVMAFAGAADGG